MEGGRREGNGRRVDDRRQAILDAAMALADEGGLGAVSMRAVADRVGVTAMALYTHVGGKADLLDALIGQLLGKLLAPAAPTDADWRSRLGGFARAARRLAVQHPWAAVLLFARPAVAPDSVRVVDLIYEALLEAGIPAPAVPRLERLLSTFVLGFAASEAGGRFGTGTLNSRGRRGQLPDGALPGHDKLARWLDQQVDWDAEFEADLRDLTELVEAIARATLTDCS